eukprot:12682989-Ditylum_brightwellii.AAC.1
MAADVKFERSEFHVKCKAILQTSDYTRIKSTVTEKLMNNNYEMSSSSSIVNSKNVFNRSYLKDAESVVKIIVKSGRDNEAQTTDLLSTFYSILPSQVKNKVTAIAKQILAASKIERMKELDKKNRGENSLNPALFRKTVVNRNQTGIKKTNVPSTENSNNSENDIEEQRHMEAALMRAQEVKNAMKNRVGTNLSQSRERVLKRNPYLTKQKNQVAPRVNTVQRPLPPQATDRPKKRLRESIGYEANSPAGDPMERCLQQVKSDTYLKHTPRVAKIARRIKANVPEGFLCTVCDSTPNK